MCACVVCACARAELYFYGSVFSFSRCGSPSRETDRFIADLHWGSMLLSAQMAMNNSAQALSDSPPVYQLSSICLGFNHLQITVILGKARPGEAAFIDTL